MTEWMPDHRPHLIDDIPRLAAASADLMLAPLAAAVTEALALGLAGDAYLARAAAIGVDRERAIEAVREVQGDRAGSAPTAEDFRDALDVLCTLGR
jgi:hypothetical protein